MFDRILGLATAIAIGLQVTVGLVFFGALTMVSLMGLSVIQGPF